MSTFSNFIRLPEEQVRYDKDLARFREEWRTIPDRVKWRVFGLDFKVGEDEKKYIPDENHPEEEVAKITLNKYPYHFEKDVRHYVLWKLNGKITKTDVVKGIREVRKIFDIMDWTYWVNPLYRKSIPGIEHAHVIVKL